MARKILLADDSVTAQNMGRKILADAGYDVLTVNNGSAALKRVAESQPDLIILDVYMPGYSGLEVCQRLKDAAETAHIPVLLSVGKLEPFKPQEARRVRADAHIVKPFEASQLLTAIARLEDQMVPQQPKGSRFATSGVAASMDDPFTRPDESRILGRGTKPSKKQNQNKDTAPAERGDPSASGSEQLSPQAASFRDFRKKAKSETASSSPADYLSDSTEEPVTHEPGPLAKLPGDITAEELSALSEVAAKLSEPPPAVQTTLASVGTIGETPVAPASEITDSQLEDEVANLPVVDAPPLAAPVSVAAEAFVTPPAPEEHKAEPPRHAVKAFEISALAKKELEIPVVQLEPTNLEPAHNDEVVAIAQLGQVESSVESAQVESSHVESPQVESQTTEFRQDSQESDAQVPDVVSMASFAQEPSPVDQQDEPMFASPRAEQPYAEALTQTGEPHTSSSDATAPAQSIEHVNADADENEKKEEFASIDSSFAQAVFGESTSTTYASGTSVSTETSPVEVSASDSISAEIIPVSASAPATDEAVEPEPPMPSDAALAEALRLLMPAAVQAEPAPQLAVAVPATSQWSDAEETMELPLGKRWVAEAMTLTPEETAMSLEAEMFRSFAASAEKIEVLPVENPLAAIQLAVENRLAAEAEAAATAQLESAAEAAPKAMAAVAPAGLTSATSTESDIASIVEKVMADLRPKIVEEIARKLASK